MAGTWRGILGTVKVSFGTTGATEEFIRLLPEGIGVIIAYAERLLQGRTRRLAGPRSPGARA